jgi:hypothetical protein
MDGIGRQTKRREQGPTHLEKFKSPQKPLFLVVFGGLRRDSFKSFSPTDSKGTLYDPPKNHPSFEAHIPVIAGNCYSLPHTGN